MRFVWMCAGALLLLAMPGVSYAQRTDSTRAGVTSPAQQQRAADSLRSPGVSARRSFATSLLIPGSMQVRFKRPKAAAIFLLAEGGGIGMSVKSWNDLSKAKKARADTVGSPVLDGQGNPVIDPVTGLPSIIYAPRNKNIADRVRARRAHLEDWIAVVVFNHLFSGVDAFVAANLADFDANVGSDLGERRVKVSARVPW